MHFDCLGTEEAENGSFGVQYLETSTPRVRQVALFGCTSDLGANFEPQVEDWDC